MSFWDPTMTNIKEVLRHWQTGQSARAIARDRVVDRRTAGRYIEAAVLEGVGKTTELTEEIICRVAARVQTREPPPRSASRKELDALKHIVAAGIAEVFYIQPYPKSQAEDLHSDSIQVAPEGPSNTHEKQQTRVVFRPFSGIGPRREGVDQSAAGVANWPDWKIDQPSAQCDAEREKRTDVSNADATR